jgi:predicted  nucleic acid-binding Zn-ribbon protein
MYSGSITAPRELQAMQEEIDGLTRRQRGLEDEVLDILEALEPLQQEVDTLEGRREALMGDVERTRAELAEAEAGVDAELAVATGERDALAAQLPADLLATYERLRGQLGGIAVARLQGTQCLGCHLSLPATELDAIRRADPDAVVTHEECGRILVRS